MITNNKIWSERKFLFFSHFFFSDTMYACIHGRELALLVEIWKQFLNSC